ncbi:MAG: putative metal-dependent HD superfamily phosphohydrolase [Saprospiraceae bacterium]|jgi:predicted metal-dependent HD superfamily phosphohydrolase
MLQSEIVINGFNNLKSYLDSKPNVDRTYHDYAHSKKVAEEVFRLAQSAGIKKKDTEDLVLAAIFHDVGYATGSKNHEEVGADYAEKFLLDNGFDPLRVESVKIYILATKLSWDGFDTNSQYIRDADLNSLASENYMKISEDLLYEKINVEGLVISEDDWNDQNIDFFRRHTYHTDEANELYMKGKKQNLKRLLKKKKDALSEKQQQTLASSKAAQTQLKTSLRNHIDLSSIADNKANIMLSVNAIVITVGLPLMGQQVYESKLFIIPIIVLGLSSTISMAYATLSTRPIKMKGISNLEDIPNKKTNLFFFGNFYNMNFADYEIGIKQVVGNDGVLENSITRDLFFLGKSLGAKFNYLRICYNAFLVGMILTVILFVILSLINQVALPVQIG